MDNENIITKYQFCPLCQNKIEWEKDYWSTIQIPIPVFLDIKDKQEKSCVVICESCANEIYYTFKHHLQERRHLAKIKRDEMN